MTIFHLIFLLFLSAMLSLLLKNKPLKLIVPLQIILAFCFFVFVMFYNLTPDKISKNNTYSKKYKIEIYSTNPVNTTPPDNKTRTTNPDTRPINFPYFDENNSLQLIQKIVDWNITGLCPYGVVSNDFGKYLKPNDVLSAQPRIEIQYCKSDISGKLGDRVLVSLNDQNEINWEYSLLKIVREKYRHLYDVIGLSQHWITLYNYNSKEIQIISTKDGVSHYSYIDKNKYKERILSSGPADFNANSHILYKANNSYSGEGKASELIKLNMLSGEHEIIHKFSVETPLLPIWRGVPASVDSIMYLKKYNLLAIYLSTGSYGSTNDVFQIFDLNSNKVIFESDYRYQARPRFTVNSNGRSIGVYTRKYQRIKNSSLQITHELDQYNISLK